MKNSVRVLCLSLGASALSAAACTTTPAGDAADAGADSSLTEVGADTAADGARDTSGGPDGAADGGSDGDTGAGDSARDDTLDAGDDTGADATVDAPPGDVATDGADAVDTAVDTAADTGIDGADARGPVARQVAASSDSNGGFTCATLVDDTVKCWGANFLGQTGDADTSVICGAGPCTLSPKPVAGLVNVKKVVLGGAHGCALHKDGTVSCWGSNVSKQLGARSTEECLIATVVTPCSRTPLAVAGLTDVTDLTAGGDHTCASLKDGTMRCWGSNEKGQLGVAATVALDTCTNPVGASYPCTGTPVTPGLTDVTDFAAGVDFTCALSNPPSGAGVVTCWGGNDEGQLGDGTVTAHPTPMPIGGGVTLVTLISGPTASHVCGTSPVGGGAFDVFCWGSNVSQQIAAGTSGHYATPTALSYVTPSSSPSVTVGGFTTFVLQTDATFAAGDNAKGQLGDGTTTSSAKTTPLGLAFPATSDLDPGGFHSCALMGDGTVDCWGDNTFGQLGDGTTTEAHAPKKVF